MEIKSIKQILGLEEKPEVQSARSKKSKDSVSSDSSNLGDEVSVEIDVHVRRGAELSKGLNKAINILNVASAGVENASSVLKSVKGLSEQALKELDPDKVEILENEARSLVSSLKETVAESSYDGVKPLAGDSVRVELEQTLGPTLEFLLPDDATHSFGLSQVVLARRESIIDTRASIKRAEERIEKLKEAIHDSFKRIGGVVENLEQIASENREASTFTVRDADLAISLAQTARETIVSDPAAAIATLGSLEKSALKVLD